MKPRLLLTVIAVAALVIAGAAVIILTASLPPEQSRDQYDSYPVATDAMSSPGCPSTVTMYFKTDEAMEQATSRVESDPRFYDVVPQTKVQSYEQFKRTFKDQPELVAQARPEALPASVTFSVQGTLSRRAVLTDLRNSYTAADVPDPCEFTTRESRTSTTAPTR